MKCDPFPGSFNFNSLRFTQDKHLKLIQLHFFPQTIEILYTSRVRLTTWGLQNGVLSSDKCTLPVQLVKPCEIAADGSDSQQSCAWRVDRYNYFALLSLNSHLLVLRQDLCDVALRATDLPTGGSPNVEPSRTASLQFVQHSNSQAVLRQRPLPHFKIVPL